MCQKNWCVHHCHILHLDIRSDIISLFDIKTFLIKSLTKSTCVMRIHGLSIICARGVVSLPKITNSLLCLDSTCLMIYLSRSSWICIFSSCWIKGISASIIQNSLRCLLVLLCSARKTGPKSKHLPTPYIAASIYNCHDWDRYIVSPLTCWTL